MLFCVWISLGNFRSARFRCDGLAAVWIWEFSAEGCWGEVWDSGQRSEAQENDTSTNSNMASVVATRAPWIGADLKSSLLYGDAAAQSLNFTASMGAAGRARPTSRPGATRVCVELPTTPAKDHYCTLGIAPGASEEDIKRAYRRLALRYHPDVCKEVQCAALFMQISQAYKSIMTARQFDEAYPHNPYSEGLMGVNDDSWEDWEEWMGWEGAGTRDYSSHINYSF